MDRCVENLCVTNDVECEDGGTCVPASGQCENAMNCGTDSECLDGHVCVIEPGNSAGTCKLKSSACGNAQGEGGCPGNQTCNFETGTCSVPDVCETSIDCNTADTEELMQCGGQTCLAATACKPDRLEPNQMTSNATPFTEVAKQGTIGELTLCGAQEASGDGGVDVFTFEPDDLAGEPADGELVVHVSVPERDVGLGEMTVTVEDQDGIQVAQGTLGAMAQSGELTLRPAVTPGDQGDWTVRVAPGGEMTSAGLNYSLSVSVLEPGTVEACSNPRTITPGQRVSAEMSGEESTELVSSCLSASADRPEKIFALNVDRPQELTISAEPASEDQDASLAIRRDCTAEGTEMACVSDAGGGEVETIEDVFSAGTYFLVVQAPERGSLSEFQLSVESNALTVCGPQDNYCGEDGETANLCAVNGGSFSQVSCDAGCNPSTGGCVPPNGNRCGGAPTIQDPATSMGDDSDGSNDMADRPVQQELDFRQYANNYEIAEEGCLGDSPRTGGPEKVYAVNLPAETAVTVDAQFDDGIEGSIYLTESCSNLTGTCVKGAQGSVDDSPSVERMTYSNKSDQQQVRYLVVDTPAGEPRPTTAQVTFTYEDVICTTDSTQCTPQGNVETCNEFGTDYYQTDVCAPFRCETGTCRRPLSCSDPLNPKAQASQPGGVTWSERWVVSDANRYSNDLGGSADTDACDISSDYTAGEDMVWEVPLNAGEGLRASLRSLDSFPSVEPSLAIQSGSCGDLSDMNCLAGVQYDNNDKPLSVEYVADSQETVYVVGDSDDYQYADSAEEWEATFEVYASTCGSQGVTCNNAGGVQICEGSGEVPRTYQCPGSGSCTSGFCDTKEAGSCYDAPNITSQATSSTGFTQSINYSNYDNDLYVESCDLTAGETNGPEAVYAVDLQSGQSLRAKLDAGGSVDQPSLAVVSGCRDTSSQCKTGSNADVSTEVTYNATSSETVYLVADSDDPETTDTFNLSVRVDTTCSGPSEACDGSGNVRYCSGSGAAPEFFACSGGCSNATCGTSNDEFCYDATDITSTLKSAGGINQSVNFGNYNNDAALDACNIEPDESVGPDAVFKAQLQSNDSLSLTLNPDGSYDQGSLSIVEGCRDLSSQCLTGTHDGDPSQVSYTAGSSPETVYIVADVDDYTTDTFSLSGKIVPGCDPSETMSCNNAGNVRDCTGDGTAPFIYSCGSGGCSNGACSTKDSEFCYDAENITSGLNTNSGINKTVDLSNFANDAEYDGTGDCDFSDFEADGGDAFYAIDLQADQTLFADMSPMNSSPSYDKQPTLSVVTGCTDLAGSCQVGDHDDSTSVTYSSTQAETVYLVADASGSSPDPFTITGRVVDSCTSDGTSCTSDGDVKICGGGSPVPSYYTCGSGCSNGLCTTKDSEFCYDAEDVTSQLKSSGGINRTISPGNFSNELEFDGDADACDVSEYETDGSEAVYSATLQPNDSLSVDLASTASDPDYDEQPTVMILTSCADPATDCVSGEHDGGPSSASYINDSGQAQTVYIVADVSGSPSTVSDMVLTGSIIKGCSSENYTCDGTTVRACGAAGQTPTFYNCANGCTSGSCNGTGSDFCYDAENITSAAKSSGGLSRNISLSSYANDAEFEADNACDLSSFETQGADVFYAVDLTAGESLVADFGPLSSSSDEATLYLLEGCTDLSGQCKASAHDGSPTTLRYAADSQETVYLVADIDETNVGATYQLNARVVPTCSNESRTCTSNGNVRACSGSGSAPLYFECSSGCSNGLCSASTAEICYDAEDITTAARSSSGFSQSVSPNNYDNNIEFDGCGVVGNGEIDGGDKVFNVSLQPGDVLEADYGSSMTLLRGCADYSSQCIAGREDDTSYSSRNNVFYRADSAETVFIAADTDSAYTSDSYQLNATVQAQSCAPDGVSCGSGGSFEACNAKGTSQSSICTSCCSSAASGASYPRSLLTDEQTSTTDTVDLSGCSGSISDIAVPVEIFHTYIGDLDVDLTGPNGTTVDLHAENGGSNDDISGIYGDSLTADGNLDAFVGESANGTWTLTVEVAQYGSDGILSGWSVQTACQ
jgi:subtilisin-like proprotein convertase family protein